MTAMHRPRTQCPLCGATPRDHLFVKDSWPIARCRSCTLVFVDAAIDSAALATIYGPGYYQGDVFERLPGRAGDP